MRVICSGTSGTDRISLLRDLARLAGTHGHQIEIFDLRETMFQIAQDIGEPVDEETILDMFPRALVLLRAAALEKIVSVCEQAARCPNWIINTHAVFRWKNTMISGFDPYYLNRLKPDLYVTITSGVLALRERLLQQPRWQSVSVEDLLVWREEEQFTTEEMARMQRKPQYLLGRAASLENFYRLLFEPRRRKVYLSYPMQHVSQATERGLAEFKHRLEEEMIVFDPADVNDFSLDELRSNGRHDRGRQVHEVAGADLAVSAELTPRELQHISDQIVFRDYRLISQADFVVVYYDIPVPSPGVVSEMNFALHGGKRVYGVWLPPTEPSPFFTRYCSRSFRSADELFTYFHRYGIGRLRPATPSQRNIPG